MLNLTNKQFILNDIKSGDFTEEEQKIIIRKLNNKSLCDFSKTLYDDYDCIDNFYNSI